MKSSDAKAAGEVLGADQGIAGAMPPAAATDGSDLTLIQAVPTIVPSDPALGTTVHRLRADLPESAVVGGAAVENLDLKAQLDDSTLLVIGVILAWVPASPGRAAGTPRTPRHAGQPAVDGRGVRSGAHGLPGRVGSGLFGFEPQGFLDAWAPVFFFAMIFAIAMDYTVFLLASAKEHFEHSGDPKDAMVGSLAHSGRVIFAAGAVMVAVFFTFALSGPLPAKEMGVVLGVAVILDAFLVRLVLLPVLLRLTGMAAWWRPRRLTRLLPAIRFSHD
jgi:RND superfamily putative drug exporter